MTKSGERILIAPVSSVIYYIIVPACVCMTKSGERILTAPVSSVIYYIIVPSCGVQRLSSV